MAFVFLMNTFALSGTPVQYDDVFISCYGDRKEADMHHENLSELKPGTLQLHPSLIPMVFLFYILQVFS